MQTRSKTKRDACRRLAEEQSSVAKMNDITDIREAKSLVKECISSVKQPYEINISFDDAQYHWRKNKIYLGNGAFKYINTGAPLLRHQHKQTSNKTQCGKSGVPSNGQRECTKHVKSSTTFSKNTTKQSDSLPRRSLRLQNLARAEAICMPVC